MMVNPYGEAPLTALLLFETKKACRVRVTVIGKSACTDFSYELPEQKKHRVPVIVSADAHFETQVKDHTAALEMLREIAFPEELILNANTNRLIEYLRAHTNILENRKDADAILRSFENV